MQDCPDVLSKSPSLWYNGAVVEWQAEVCMLATLAGCGILPPPIFMRFGARFSRKRGWIDAMS